MSLSRKFRLRKERNIVGFAKETQHGLFIKGKGLLWFMSRVNYDKVDEYIGIKDKLNRDIYEMDIVSYKINKGLPEGQGVILWESELREFVLLDINHKIVIPIFLEGFNLFHHQPLEVTSHLFNHPNLSKALKLGLD